MGNPELGIGRIDGADIPVQQLRLHQLDNRKGRQGAEDGDGDANNQMLPPCANGMDFTGALVRGGREAALDMGCGVPEQRRGGEQQDIEKGNPVDLVVAVRKGSGSTLEQNKKK